MTPFQRNSAGKFECSRSPSKSQPVWLSPASSLTEAALLPTLMLFRQWTFEYGPLGCTAAVPLTVLVSVLWITQMCPTPSIEYLSPPRR